MRFSLPILVAIILLTVLVAGSQATLYSSNLNTNAALDTGDDVGVSVAANGSGVVIAVWESTDDLEGTIGNDSDILFSRSLDNGLTWETPRELSWTMWQDTGDDTDVDIATDGNGKWVVVWSSTENLNGTIGTDQDIFVVHNIGIDGAFWSVPTVLNSNAEIDCCAVSSGWDRSASIVSVNDRFVVAWHSNGNIDEASGVDQDIFLSGSDDGGVSWSLVELLNNDASTETDCLYGCEDFLPNLDTANGTTVAAWQKNLTGHGDDIIAARSTDSGLTWSDPLNVSNVEGVIGPPDVAGDGLGNWMIVWHAHNGVPSQDGGNKEIYMARSVDDGQTWSAPSVLNGNSIVDTSMDYWPTVTTDTTGTWYVAWDNWSTPNHGVGEDILFARSNDLGSTWTYPMAVEGDIGPDTGDDSQAELTRLQGRWLLVWQSNDSYDGTVGTDMDLRFTTCLPEPGLGWDVSATDSDCDGWKSGVESHVGTDPDRSCGFTPGGDPASDVWPPDLVESNTITISDVLAMKPVFNGSSIRHDFMPSDGTITISDVLALKPFFGTSCTP